MTSAKKIGFGKERLEDRDSLRNFGAGDRDRNGDVQLEKLAVWQ
jgi:hypothetical protein